MEMKVEDCGEFENLSASSTNAASRMLLLRLPSSSSSSNNSTITINIDPTHSNDNEDGVEMKMEVGMDRSLNKGRRESSRVKSKRIVGKIAKNPILITVENMEEKESSKPPSPLLPPRREISMSIL